LFAKAGVEELGGTYGGTSDIVSEQKEIIENKNP